MFNSNIEKIEYDNDIIIPEEEKKQVEEVATGDKSETKLQKRKQGKKRKREKEEQQKKKKQKSSSSKKSKKESFGLDEPMKKKRKFSNQNELEDPARLQRTLKISNFPFRSEDKLGKLKRRVKQTFKKYGEIESIRFRGLPVRREGKIPKDVLVKKAKFTTLEDGKTHKILCFVVYKNKDSVDEAIKECNNSQFLDGTIFVECASKKKSKKSKEKNAMKKVFVGNIPFDASEEDILDCFNKKEKLLGGKPVKAIIPRDEKNRNKGVCTIEFENEKLAQNVFTRKLKITLNGQRFRFKKYKTKTEVEKDELSKKKKPGDKKDYLEEKKKRKKEKRKNERVKKKKGDKNNNEDVSDGDKKWWMGVQSKREKTVKLKKGEKKKKKKKIKKD